MNNSLINEIRNGNIKCPSCNVNLIRTIDYKETYGCRKCYRVSVIFQSLALELEKYAYVRLNIRDDLYLYTITGFTNTNKCKIIRHLLTDEFNDNDLNLLIDFSPSKLLSMNKKQIIGKVNAFLMLC